MRLILVSSLSCGWPWLGFSSCPKLLSKYFFEIPGYPRQNRHSICLDSRIRTSDDKLSLEGVLTQWTYSNQPTFNNSTHAQSNSHFVCQPSLENCHADSDLWVSRDQIRIPPSGSQPDRESKSVPTTHTNPLLMGRAYGRFHSRQSMHRVFTQTC